jgi:hypothetical protein
MDRMDEFMPQEPRRPIPPARIEEPQPDLPAVITGRDVTGLLLAEDLHGHDEIIRDWFAKEGKHTLNEAIEVLDSPRAELSTVGMHLDVDITPARVRSAPAEDRHYREAREGSAPGPSPPSICAPSRAWR